MNIGTIIHRIRKDKKMTLLELSVKSGVALATLSRMENGKMTGTLESHVNICQALEVSLPELYKDLIASSQKVEMRAQDTNADVFIHDNRSKSELLVSNSMNKKMLPMLIRISRGGCTHSEETKMGIEKFVYVLDGKLEAVMGKETFHLVKGDTLYFVSSIPHYFKNTGTAEARLISVISPPAL